MGLNNINILTPSFIPGGSEKNAIFLSNEFSKKKYQTTLISLKNEGILKKNVSNKVKLILLGKKRNRYKFFLLYKILKKKKQILSIMRDSNIICLICSFFIKKIKIIIREGNRLNNLNFFYSFFLKLLYMRADKIIVNSNDIKKDLCRPFNFLNKKIIIIHNPILIKKNIKYKIKKKKNFYNILNIAKFYKQKNHFLLLDIFQQMLKKNKKLNLILVGHGPEKDKIINKIEELKIKNKVKILKPRVDINYLYKSSDIFLLTSKYEGFPNVLSEAIYNKIYTISTPASSSVYDIIYNKKYGVVSKSFNSKEISNLVLKNLNKKILNNKDFIKKFSPKKVLFKYEKILTDNL